MKLEHEAGKELFIDFAGKKLHITDRNTSEKIPVEVFVTILPHSQYTYCKRAKVQKMGYVYFSPDKSYYSVAYRYIGKHTLI